MRSFFLCLCLLLLPGSALAEPEAGAALSESALPDLPQLVQSGWQDIAWLTHRSDVRARRYEAALVPWTRWVAPPRPGDRSLLVVEQAGTRSGLVFHGIDGLVRVETFVPASPDAVIAAVQAQLGRGTDARPEGYVPTPGPEVLRGWVGALTSVSAVEGGALVVVEVPRAQREALVRAGFEPWDKEGIIPREVAQARLAVGVPLLAGSFVAALILLPFTRQNPAASLAVAGPLGAGIAMGSALTISGGAKMRGSLPRAELAAWREAAPGLED